VSKDSMTLTLVEVFLNLLDCVVLGAGTPPPGTPMGPTRHQACFVLSG
jgi:hypothetical protein